VTDRAVSVTVNYVLTLTITALLLSGLVVATGGLIESQSERAIQSELDVLGQQLAADIESADRLATVGGNDGTEVMVETALPARVVGQDYRITVRGSELELRTTDPEISVTVPFTTATDVTAKRPISGGNVLIRSSTRTENDTLEVERA
jgi:hypothetical protein